MPVSSITLVANDQRLVVDLLPCLNKLAGRLVSVSSLTTAQDLPAPCRPGVVLLAPATPDEAAQVVALVKGISLQKWPLAIVVLETAAAREGKDLSVLDPFITRRLHWPEQASALADLLKHLPPTRKVQATPPADDQELPQPIRRALEPTPSLRPLLQRILIAAAHDVTIFLTGETGTGKTFLARLIHDCSPRKNQPFMPIPCGALSASLIASELFGHVRGAFTGADRDKMGRLAAARAGTVLLDEVDTLGLEQQANLLRVVETGEYEPVGSSETQMCAARLIVASNVDIDQEVKNGKFREDLWYRLNVLSLYLLPLRERVQDIAPLTLRMAARFAWKFRKDLFEITPEALAALENYPWQGNIRQLENVVQQAVLMSKGPRLLREHLPEPIRQAFAIRSLSVSVPGTDRPSQAPLAVGASASLEQTLDLEERDAIQHALVANNFSRSRTAAALGVSRVTLYKKLRKHGLMNGLRRPAG